MLERLIMKTKNVTFSLPSEVAKLLQSLIEKRQRSSFAANVLKMTLEELLKAEYAQANDDPDVLTTVNDWRHLDAQGWR